MITDTENSQPRAATDEDAQELELLRQRPVEQDADRSRDNGSIDEHRVDKNKQSFKRPLLIVGGSIAALVALAIAARMWLHSRAYESTDDAFIEGHVVQIGT